MKILKEQTKKPMEGMTIHEMVITAPYKIYGSDVCFGIDPGTSHLGVAKIYPNNRDSITICEVSFTRADRPVDRMLDAQYILAHTLFYFGHSAKAVIEGAAFGNMYRQAELAEQRASMALWLHKFGVEVEFVPPKTIRKSIFGHGNTKNPWEGIIPDNSAAAIGCAYHAMTL